MWNYWNLPKTMLESLLSLFAINLWFFLPKWWVLEAAGCWTAISVVSIAFPVWLEAKNIRKLMRQPVFRSSQANFGWSTVFWWLQKSIQTEAYLIAKLRPNPGEIWLQQDVIWERKGWPNIFCGLLEGFEVRQKRDAKNKEILKYKIDQLFSISSIQTLLKSRPLAT